MDKTNSNRELYIIETDKMFGNYHMISLFLYMGHRVGYIGVPENTANAVNYEYVAKTGDVELAIDIYGGITFNGRLHDVGLNKYYYLGFDCAHYNDLIDEESFKKYWPNKSISIFKKTGTVKDINFVNNELITLLEKITRKESEEFKHFCKVDERTDLYCQWLANALPNDLSDSDKLMMRLCNIIEEE